MPDQDPKPLSSTAEHIGQKTAEASAKPIFCLFVTEEGFKVLWDRDVLDSMMADDVVHLVIAVLDCEMKKLATEYMAKRGGAAGRPEPKPS